MDPIYMIYDLLIPGHVHDASLQDLEPTFRVSVRADELAPLLNRAATLLGRVARVGVVL